MASMMACMPTAQNPHQNILLQPPPQPPLPQKPPPTPPPPPKAELPHSKDLVIAGMDDDGIVDVEYDSGVELH
eukprot:14441895-Alexandrium_andersonii.AAC.1